MDFGTALLYVLAVIAIIFVAGLIIYLLAALVVSIIDKKEVKPFSADNEEAHEKQENNERLLLEDKDYKLSFAEEPKKEKEKDEEPREIGEQIDLDLADEEKKQIEERQRIVNQPVEEEEEDEDLEAMYQKLIQDINSEAAEEAEPATQEPVVQEETVESEVVEEPVEEMAEEETTKTELDELRAQLAALQAKLDENEKAEEPAEEEAVAQEADQEQEVAEEIVEAVEEEPAEEVEAEEAHEEPEANAELDELRAELAALQSQLAEEQAEKDELAKKLEEKPAVEKVYETVETESLEALLQRREVLEERLLESERELKANKKEYVPLSRIKKNLETDKAKLRRKEAVVAKQKVMLFGVNNYVVDPEKEKKLSEDLDVLDALRLSVQHCEEVMKDNEDRYPILEKTNGILTKQVEDLKADIADLDARIAKLQGDDAEGTDAE